MTPFDAVRRGNGFSHNIESGGSYDSPDVPVHPKADELYRKCWRCLNIHLCEKYPDCLKAITTCLEDVSDAHNARLDTLDS